MRAAAEMTQANAPATSLPPELVRPIVPRLLTDLLDEAVAEHGDWPAIDFLGRHWTSTDRSASS